jgi:hypothetical protein
MLIEGAWVANPAGGELAPPSPALPRKGERRMRVDLNSRCAALGRKGSQRGRYVRSTFSMIRSSWFSVLQTVATWQKRLYWSMRLSPWPQ